MRYMMAMYWVLIAGISLMAQTINISGTVTDKNSGKPINGAIITLVGRNCTATTDYNGAYTLISSAIVNQSIPSIAGVVPIMFKNGMIEVNLPTARPVTIERFDLSGNLLEQVQYLPSTAGTYRFPSASGRYSMQMMVLRITVGGTVSTFRVLPFKGGSNIGRTSTTRRISTTEQVAKITVTVDSLSVTASKYSTSTIPISSYEGTYDIALDSISLEKFSFFVTSLKALQELSGSENGFGGDLRFGKTGEGAGLLGADSICQCIAERSMPGSKVKQWRAFLSVAKGPEGKQVNAIDRVGEGPWYDRLGRLLAPTLKDLLDTRPMNGDPEIKNDLPNEDGVPNHRPDPTKDEVDNHHFITGSKTDGTLYDATATCADWTTTDSSAVAGRPRCGFSWPRSSKGTFHWISGLSVHGCGAGIQITEQNGGVGAVIGAGGGYGGFYCFALTP